MSGHDEDLPAEERDEQGEQVPDLDVTDEDGQDIKGGIPRIPD